VCVCVCVMNAVLLGFDETPANYEVCSWAGGWCFECVCVCAVNVVCDTHTTFTAHTTFMCKPTTQHSCTQLFFLEKMLCVV